MFTKQRRWTTIAALLWAVALVALLLRAALHPARPNSLATYLTGGEAWLHAQPLYTNWRGFVYPPVVGWFFSLLAHLPLALAAVSWHALAAGVFLLGLVALLRSGVFHRIPPEARGIVAIAVLPLSIGNMDNAQANPLVAGLMMLSVAATQSGAWTLAAVAIGIAATFKIYPVALALLLILVRPRQLSWRILLVLGLLAAQPYLVQNPQYVSGQYHAWLASRLADDRFHYPMKDAPLDLWYLLVRICALPLSERLYTATQCLAGAALAVLVLVRIHRKVATQDILASLYLLVSVWMLLLGPATENQTYIILAPAACLLTVEAFSRPGLPLVRVFAATGFSLLILAVARNSLMPHLKSPGFMAIQPVGALLLIPAILLKDFAPASPQ